MNGQAFYKQYIERFQDALIQIEARDAKGDISMGQALDQARHWLEDAESAGRKIMIVGNGGSAGVADHLAVDFWKNGGVKAFTFNQGPVLTCVANDYSYEDVFSVPIDQFADADDIVMAISSSGSSENILRAARMAHEKSCKLITCSGFQPNNALRTLGHLNFYVPSFSYGFVETLHQFILHSLLDVKMYLSDRRDIFHRNEAMSKMKK